MTVAFDKSFSESLDKIKNEQLLLSKIEKCIVECETASALSEISNIKKVFVLKNYFKTPTKKPVNNSLLVFGFKTTK